MHLTGTGYLPRDRNLNRDTPTVEPVTLLSIAPIPPLLQPQETKSFTSSLTLPCNIHAGIKATIDTHELPTVTFSTGFPSNVAVVGLADERGVVSPDWLYDWEGGGGAKWEPSVLLRF